MNIFLTIRYNFLLKLKIVLQCESNKVYLVFLRRKIAIFFSLLSLLSMTVLQWIMPFWRCFFRPLDDGRYDICLVKRMKSDASTIGRNQPNRYDAIDAFSMRKCLMCKRSIFIMRDFLEISLVLRLDSEDCKVSVLKSIEKWINYLVKKGSWFSFPFERTSFVRSRRLTSYSSERGQVFEISLFLRFSLFVLDVPFLLWISTTNEISYYFLHYH